MIYVPQDDDSDLYLNSVLYRLNENLSTPHSSYVREARVLAVVSMYSVHINA